MRQKVLHVAVFVAAFLMIPAMAFAASDSDFTQQINNGALAADIMNASRVSVASPAVTMDAKSFSFDCQTSTKPFGTTSERIYVSDGDTTNSNGWTLSVAATSGASTLWTAGGNNFDFNNPAGSGCTGGQMAINPTAGTVTADCTGCNTTGVSLGSSTAFNQGTTDSITLMNASGSAANIWRGYLTGANVTQTIPAGQTPGNYSIDLTLTLVAN
jgi:hypothetical protein